MDKLNPTLTCPATQCYAEMPGGRRADTTATSVTSIPSVSSRGRRALVPRGRGGLTLVAFQYKSDGHELRGVAWRGVACLVGAARGGRVAGGHSFAFLWPVTRRPYRPDPDPGPSPARTALTWPALACPASLPCAHFSGPTDHKRIGGPPILPRLVVPSRIPPSLCLGN